MKKNIGAKVEENRYTRMKIGHLNDVPSFFEHIQKAVYFGHVQFVRDETLLRRHYLTYLKINGVRLAHIEKRKDKIAKAITKYRDFICYGNGPKHKIYASRK